MLDVQRRFRLALQDMARRTGLKLGAGVVALLGAVYLLSALWSALAHDLGWGPTLASLAIGVLCVAIAGVMLAIGARDRHPMPTGEDVANEVKARASLAAEAAVATVKNRANMATQAAQQKVAGLMDRASFGASRAAQAVDSHGERLGREAGEGVEAARDALRRLGATRAGPAVGLAGAFALGLAIAAGLGRGGRDDDAFDDDEDWSDAEDWPEDEDWS